ncbi:calcium-binding protein [Synechococcus sp. W2B2]|uniref:calcium-binding protein n=1 Tax=unclassified Synechococcus TaxID=2626047 RepID=UPI00006B6873|nr:hypothetical protein [Synechococcus sp. WH 7805]EAR17397.1 hypothetical protein WH7805_10763 [Synechococcus sp. WH 7805]
MAILANNPPFTNQADQRRSSNGWRILRNISAEAGNDFIEGRQRLSSNSSGIGIEIFGSVLDTEFGNDTVKGIARAKNGVATGIDIFGKTLINGNEIGDSAIDSGADNDKVIGRGNSRTGIAYGIEINGGKIDSGLANDRITGNGKSRSGDAYGISLNGSNAETKIDTGLGNDSVVGKARSRSGNAFGINNLRNSTIDTGDGDDTVTGVASSDTGAAVGIFNNGVIDGGAGDDVFDALTGGWGGNGRADLGSGNDTVRGFGSGTFDGGVGFDTLVFNAGTYNIARVGSQLDRFEITLSSLQNSPVMTVTEFEFFGEGDQQTSFASAVAAGQITFI